VTPEFDNSEGIIVNYNISKCEVGTFCGVGTNGNLLTCCASKSVSDFVAPYARVALDPFQGGGNPLFADGVKYLPPDKGAG
jgi:hypothetical protein